MLTINKITSHSVVDFAAEELRKYLRMMMPECGNISIFYNPDAKDGFKLGLMQDFGLDVSDAADTNLDDIVYIDCSEKGGIIAGDNPRSVLLSVYEYLRQNDCRWLLPGVDGEYIPMQYIKPVKYRHKPSCRYRGWCSEGAQFQGSVLDAIDLAPKLGMNVYMMQFVNPVHFYTRYYLHKGNNENRSAEPISEKQVLQWKRQCEAEISKRGLQLHDIGHGFNCFPFGLEQYISAQNGDWDSVLSDEQKEFLPMINGKRTIWGNDANCTNFCMSNPKAREKVVNYVADFAKNHSNVDYLHVWLADGSNNHCECEECQKKTPSDWYVILLNEIDKKFADENIATKIVFIAYVDTTWAPLEEKIKNSDRFALLFAPIYRSYNMSAQKSAEKFELLSYNRNKNKFPNTFEKSLLYLDEWKKVWKGSNLSYEYHYWRHQCYDLSGRMQAKLVNQDIKVYKENDVNGVIACGTQRPFFPTGLSFYTFARTLFDTSLSYEEIEKDYFSHAFGKDWKLFRDYLEKIYESLPFDFFARDIAWNREGKHFAPDMAEKIAEIRNITKEGRKLFASHLDYDSRAQITSVKLLEYHADFCDLVSDWMSAKARGEYELSAELLNKARIETGKFECEIQSFFDHNLYFTEYVHTQNLGVDNKEINVISIE